MAKTVPTENISRNDVAYVLVAQPSEALQQEIARLLGALEKELPGVIWTMPSGALHFTLYEIIQPKEYSENKEELYSRHQQEYEELPAKILSSIQPIEVNFNTVEASPYAIIIRGDDDGIFNDIRTHLIKQLPIIAESKLPPDIIHSSIARYVKEADLEQVQEIIKRYPINFKETVTEFKLLKNRIFPLLEYDTIKTYTLGR